MTTLLERARGLREANAREDARLQAEIERLFAEDAALSRIIAAESALKKATHNSLEAMNAAPASVREALGQDTVEAVSEAPETDTKSKAEARSAAVATGLDVDADGGEPGSLDDSPARAADVQAPADCALRGDPASGVQEAVEVETDGITLEDQRLLNAMRDVRSTRNVAVVKDAADALGLYPNALGFSLRRLVTAGRLVRQHKEGEPARYLVSDLGGVFAETVEPVPAAPIGKTRDQKIAEAADAILERARRAAAALGSNQATLSIQAQVEKCGTTTRRVHEAIDILVSRGEVERLKGAFPGDVALRILAKAEAAK